MQSKLTLIGIYNYDPTLFSNLSMPAGVDTDVVRDEILIRSGEFEVLYSDPAFIKMLIGHWSKKHLRTFEKWFKALSIEYDPLNNYDRTEEYTDIRSGSGSRENTSGRKYTDNSVDTGTENTNTSESFNETNGGSESVSGADNTKSSKTASNVGNSSGHTTGSTSPAQTTNTKTTSVAAYDSATFQTKEQTTDALTLQVAGSDSSDTSSSTMTSDSEAGSNDRNYSEQKNKIDNLAHSGSHTNEGTSSRFGSRAGSDDQTNSEKLNNNETTQHRAHLFGNIGVTTSQQMLQSELDVQRFNLYEQIADIFVEEFCLMVY